MTPIEVGAAARWLVLWKDLDHRSLAPPLGTPPRGLADPGQGDLRRRRELAPRSPRLLPAADEQRVEDRSDRESDEDERIWHVPPSIGPDRRILNPPFVLSADHTGYSKGRFRLLAFVAATVISIACPMALPSSGSSLSATPAMS